MNEADKVVYVTERNKKRIKVLKAKNDFEREDQVITMLLDKYSSTFSEDSKVKI